MNNKILKIILICILVLTASFILFTIINHHNKVSITNNLNIQKGDTLNFDDVDIEVLNVATYSCDIKKSCEDNHTEISVKVTYNNEITYYTLDTYSNNKQRIDNSNYYILCNYDKDKQIKIEVKDKAEI